MRLHHCALRAVHKPPRLKALFLMTDSPFSQAHTGIIARLHASMDEIPAQLWNALLAQQSQPTPFMRHAYLLAMEQSQSATANTGWQPQHLCLWQEDSLLAACPLYLKSHSWGEYVFDFAWANAYERNGMPYYPKALVAPPFTPTPGSRLLAIDDAHRALLVQALVQWCTEQQLETAHILFLSAQDQQACTEQGWLLRKGVQFHWRNQTPGGAGRFETLTHFLASLQREKRKKIKQEMRKVADAGVHYRIARGNEISTEDWAFFYQCYATTYREHGNAPYLTPAFWQAMQDTMPENWLMLIAEREQRPIATSLLALHDKELHHGLENIAYGRYWGAIERIDCLHFDLCYYQPLAWCIAHGFDRFEGGAQGEHKLARALLPEPTYSAHWIAHPQFEAAIANHLAHESKGMQQYQLQLQAHSPYRSPAALANSPQSSAANTPLASNPE